MGGNQSIVPQGNFGAQYGHIFLRTDKHTYNAGETVTGNVYLYLLQELPANKLFLRFKGREHSEWRTPQRAHGDNHMKKNNIFMDSVVPLQVHSPTLKGQYVIPFAFALEPELPSTFFIKGIRCVADIRYRLEVFFEPINAGEPKWKFKQEIAVQYPVKLPEHLKEEMDVTLKGGCCMSAQGVIPMKLKPSKRVVYPGELLDVEVTIDLSKLQFNTRSVALSLEHVYYLHYSMGLHRAFDYKVKVDLPAVKAGEVGNFRVQLQIPHNIAFNKPYKKKGLDQLLYGFTDDHSVISTPVRTDNIHSVFFLNLMTAFNEFSYSFPALYLPIDIRYPQIPMTPIATPPEWQPQVLDTNNLVMVSKLKEKNKTYKAPYDDKLAPTTYGLYGLTY